MDDHFRSARGAGREKHPFGIEGRNRAPGVVDLGHADDGHKSGFALETFRIVAHDRIDGGIRDHIGEMDGLEVWRGDRDPTGQSVEFDDSGRARDLRRRRDQDRAPYETTRCAAEAAHRRDKAEIDRRIAVGQDRPGAFGKPGGGKGLVLRRAHVRRNGSDHRA